jgi:hypothetical protein
LEERALELYKQNAGKPGSIEPIEYAQLLPNDGILLPPPARPSYVEREPPAFIES